jgi:hypothetical protein
MEALYRRKRRSSNHEEYRPPMFVLVEFDQYGKAVVQKVSP